MSAPKPSSSSRRLLLTTVLLTTGLLASTLMIPFASHPATGEPVVAGRFNPGVDNPNFTLDSQGTLVSMDCGIDGRPSCRTAAGFYPSMSGYPIVSLEVAKPVPDVEGHASWDGGAYDEVVHGREWNSGPGQASSTLPPDRLGISTTAADGVCPMFGYVRVPYPYLGTDAGSPWGHGGNSDCRAVAAAHTDLGPEFTGPAINWLLANYLGDGHPAEDAPLGTLRSVGIDLLGADADVRTAAIVYAYHLLSPASVRAGASAARSTLPFGLPPGAFTAGQTFGNGVSATEGQIPRIQAIGDLLAKQAMRSARWGPYRSVLDWRGGVPPASVGATATLRVYIGGCGPSGPNGEPVACSPTTSGAPASAPTPDGGVYGVARPGATWNEDNGIGLIHAPAPTSMNGASIEPSVDPSCPDTPPGWTCDDGFASFTVTINKPGPDTFSFTSGRLPDWEPEMWASTIGQDAAFPSGTNRTVSATLDFELDQPVFVRVAKRSSDPTIAVAGGVFELLDAAGGIIGSAATDAGGTLDFGPIDTQVHPVPYSVRETAAPVGLQAISGDQLVGEAPYAYSSDPTNPTTAVVTDSPVLAAVRVRKMLSDPSAQPADMNGFAFSVSRTVDHQHFAELATAANGVTPGVSVPAGAFDICETQMPSWAQVLSESVGCQRVIVDGSGADVEFVFTNPIVRPQTATQLSTPVAGAGDSVVEWVWTRNWQAAGRAVTVTAALYANPHGAAPETTVCDSTTQATPLVTTTLLATDAEQVTALPPMTIPTSATESATSSGSTSGSTSGATSGLTLYTGSDFYAAGTIVDQATGALVAELPCGDVNERVVVPTITTAAPVVVAEGEQAHDTYQVQGLPTDLDWNATGHFRLVAAPSDRCDAPVRAAGSFDERILAEGRAVTDAGVPIPVAGTLYRFQESLSVAVVRPGHPPGWTLSPPHVVAGSLTYSTTAELCAPEESSPAPLVVTRVSETMLSSALAQPSIDTAEVSGFGTADLDPAVWSVRLLVGLYQHDPWSDPATWTCTDENLVANHAAVEVHGDGHYTTDGVVAYPAGVVLSNQARLAGSRRRSDGSVAAFETLPEGCQQVSETQWVPNITTRASNQSPVAGTTNSDIGVVAGLPPDFAGTIRLDIFRFVPGGSIPLADACQPSMLGATLSYAFTGTGEHVSPQYSISPDEVAGVQYVHQETLLSSDGRTIASERCAVDAEVATISRPQPPGRLIRTS